MSAHAIPRLSPEEYLRIEREAETKSEYDNGVMFAMSGGSLAHSSIAVRLIAAMTGQLDGKGCRVVGSDLRIQVARPGPYFYPDLSVVCGEPQLADDQKDMLLNPVVIFEVLSKSTEAYDRGQKFAHYRRLESLRDYVLVSQGEPLMEVFSKGEAGTWTLTEFVGIEAVCRISSVGCEVALAEAYRDVTFEAA